MKNITIKKGIAALLILLLIGTTSCYHRSACAKRYNKTTWVPHKAKQKHRTYGFKR